MAKLKKYDALPVHIVEDHNQALHPILRAIATKHLPFYGNVMLHFDSHPDLLIPANLKKEEVFNKESLLNRISIENWIMPSVFAGHFDTIVWVKPPWSNQIDNGVYHFEIGLDKGTNSVMVSSTEPYFLSDMLYSPAEQLSECRALTLIVMTLGHHSDTDVEILTRIIEERLGIYVLDVDLDFFSTNNPFLDLYVKANTYEKLKAIYSYEENFDSTSNPCEFVDLRKSQILPLARFFDELNKVDDFTQIRDRLPSLLGNIPDVFKARVQSLVLSILDSYQSNQNASTADKNPSESVIDWQMVHDAGCTFDLESRLLPHHPSTSDEINSLMEEFKSFLSKFSAPSFITCARSSLDNYCPPDQVDSIESSLCQLFEHVYQPIKIVRDE